MKDKKGQQEKTKKNAAWELHRLCRNYLNENCKAWDKRRKARQKEAERQERLQKGRVLKRKAQINELEKKIEVGMTRIPQDQREKMEEELRQEKMKEKIELSQAKSDLWKLKSREKKMGDTKVTTELEKIKKLTEKVTKIVEILNTERERVENETS